LFEFAGKVWFRFLKLFWLCNSRGSVFVEPTVGAQPISQTSVVNTILLQNTQTISFPIRWPANGFYQVFCYAFFF
jgi:hypothetical protein